MQDQSIETTARPATVEQEILEAANINFAHFSPDATLLQVSSSLNNTLAPQSATTLLSAVDSASLANDTVLLNTGLDQFTFDVKRLSDDSVVLILQKTSSSAALSELNDALQALADCNLDNSALNQNHNELQDTWAYLQSTVANLNEVIKQINRASTAIDNTVDNLRQQSQDLDQRSQRQGSALQNTASSMEELRATVTSNAENSRQAATMAMNAARLAESTQEQVSQMSKSVATIQQCSQEMIGIVDLIDNISLQTQILSLNAAVESARAGDHGKGFGIIAQEVRALSLKTKDAAGEIKALINNSNRVSDDAQVLAKETDNRVTEMATSVEQVATSIDHINNASQEQSHGIAEATRAVEEITLLTDQNSQAASELSSNTEILKGEVGYMNDALGVFKLNRSEFSHPLHQQIKQVVEAATQAITQAFNKAVDQGQITEASLFDRNYKEIQNTNPQKFRSAFDTFTDQHIRPLQEHWLQQHTALVYLIATDDHGYVPTHNTAFCKPLTGNPKVDIGGNRTKRIFTDRVGQTAGKHTDPYRIQTYRRDTGELMFDISIPVLIRGKHWGGIRAGYLIG